MLFSQTMDNIISIQDIFVFMQSSPHNRAVHVRTGSFFLLFHLINFIFLQQLSAYAHDVLIEKTFSNVHNRQDLYILDSIYIPLVQRTRPTYTLIIGLKLIHFL